MTRHREIKRVIYTLKRQWGKPATLSRETTSLDLDTGVETPTVTATKSISRAILLPRKISTDFAYDLSFIAANKNFTYGGFFGKSQQFILIDADDLDTYIIEKNDYVTVNNRKMVIDDLDKYDEGGSVIAYALLGTYLEAQRGL